MDVSKVSLSLVKYSITKCEIISPNLRNNYTVLAETITDLTIENDYENYTFPFFELKCQIPNTTLRAIRKNPLDIKISLTMIMGYYDEIQGDEVIKPKSTSTFINDRFIAFIDNQDGGITDLILEDYEKEEEYNYGATDMNSTTPVGFLLYKEDDLNKANLTVNAVLSNASLMDSLTYTLNVAGISNVLVSPPNKFTRYSQFILTPIHVIEQLDRICNDYGLHTNGTLIFFGLDRKYIIDFNPRCTAYSTNEYQITYFYYPVNSSNALLMSAGCAKVSSEKANYILLNQVKFTDKSTAADYGIAHDITEIDSYKGTQNRGSSDYSTYGIRNTGEDNSSVIRKKINSYQKTAIVGLRNVDLSMLTPNKQFLFTIDDSRYKKYNGNYMLIKATTVFSKEGSFFTPITTCDFRC